MFLLPNYRTIAGACLALVSIVALQPFHANAEEKITWQHTYIPNLLPELSIPKWHPRRDGSPMELLNNGKLIVKIPTGSSLFFRQGTHLGEKQLGDGMWDASSGNTTVDFSLSCQADNPNDRIFVIRLSDGTSRWDIHFQSDRITAEGLAKIFKKNTKEEDVYRIIIQGNMAQLSSKLHGILLSDIPARKVDNQRNRLIFGTDSRDKSTAPQSAVGWELSYLQWSNRNCYAPYQVGSK